MKHSAEQTESWLRSLNRTKPIKQETREGSAKDRSEMFWKNNRQRILAYNEGKKEIEV